MRRWLPGVSVTVFLLSAGIIIPACLSESPAVCPAPEPAYDREPYECEYGLPDPQTGAETAPAGDAPSETGPAQEGPRRGALRHLSFGLVRCSDFEQNRICVSTSDNRGNWYFHEYDLSRDEWRVRDIALPAELVDRYSGFFLVKSTIYLIRIHPPEIYSYTFPEMRRVTEVRLRNPSPDRYLLVDTSGEKIFCLVGGFGAAQLYRLSPDLKVETEREVPMTAGGSCAADDRFFYFHAHSPTTRHIRSDHDFTTFEDLAGFMRRDYGASAHGKGWIFFDSWRHIYAYDAATFQKEYDLGEVSHDAGILTIGLTRDYVTVISPDRKTLRVLDWEFSFVRTVGLP